jgi:hypothetical protein
MTPKAPWIVETDAVLGLHEIRDRTKLAAWLKSDGKTLGDPAKLPWCGDLVDTAIARALPHEPRPGPLGENPYWALNWGHLGKACQPCLHAVVTFKRPSGGHVGFLMGEDATHYLVRGGNQGNTVSDTWIAKSRARAIRWPSTYPNPRAPLPKLKRSGAVSTNEA